jgi:hypothetical protein
VIPLELDPLGVSGPEGDGGETEAGAAFSEFCSEVGIKEAAVVGEFCASLLSVSVAIS